MKEFKQALIAAVRLMTPSEKRNYWLATLGRCFSGVLDIIAIIGIGVLATIFVRTGEPNSKSLLGEFSAYFNYSNYHILALIVLLLFVVKSIVSTYLIRSSGQRLANTEARASRKIADQYLRSPQDVPKSGGRNEIIYALQVGTQALYSGLLASTSTVIAEGFLFVIVIVAFFWVDAIATMGLLAFFALMALVIHFLVSHESTKAASVNAQNALKANEVLDDAIDAQKELRVLNRIDFFLDQIYKFKKLAAESYSRQLYLNGLPRYIVETGLIFGVTVLLFVKLSNNNLEFGLPTVAIFLSGGLRIMAAMLPLQNAVVNIRQQLPHVRRTVSLLDSGKGPATSPFEDGNLDDWTIKAESVTLSYPKTGRTILQDANFEIKFGSQVAILGQSGMGKSTLIDAIAGLVEVSSGKISIGGQDSRSLLAKSNSGVSYVPQNPRIIKGTLAENIALGIPPQLISATQIEAALEMANLTSLVKALPNGVETQIDSQVTNFSGGEIQRIGIARALYNRCKVLILDEPTAALDNLAEEFIAKSLRNLRGKCTVILVTHRTNAFKEADQYLLLEQGRLFQYEKFEILLNANPKLLSSDT
jgi:ABC-type multidrug transport system fused ATPase/permease subunit